MKYNKKKDIYYYIRKNGRYNYSTEIIDYVLDTLTDDKKEIFIFAYGPDFKNAKKRNPISSKRQLFHQRIKFVQVRLDNIYDNVKNINDMEEVKRFCDGIIKKEYFNFKSIYYHIYEGGKYKYHKEIIDIVLDNLTVEQKGIFINVYGRDFKNTEPRRYLCAKNKTFYERIKLVKNNLNYIYDKAINKNDKEELKSIIDEINKKKESKEQEKSQKYLLRVIDVKYLNNIDLQPKTIEDILLKSPLSINLQKFLPKFTVYVFLLTQESLIHKNLSIKDISNILQVKEEIVHKTILDCLVFFRMHLEEAKEFLVNYQVDIDGLIRFL